MFPFEVTAEAFSMVIVTPGEHEPVVWEVPGSPGKRSESRFYHLAR